MLRRSLIILALLISLSALLASHWLTGQPQAVMSIRATVPDAQGRLQPAAQTRFDILNRSVRTLLDSLCRIETISPPEQIIRVLEDPGRETFLRGVIERRGFMLSPQARETLKRVAQTRRLYIANLRRQPSYDILIDAVRRVLGPLIDLDRPPRDSSILPAYLRQETRLFDPYRNNLMKPDSRLYELYSDWMRAVEAYDYRYHRDLIERAIVATAIYREAAVASVETDSLGLAVFPPVRYGRYWIVGHYPPDIDALNRAHRSLLARRASPSPPSSASILTWDMPITITAMLPVLDLSEANAASIDAVPFP